MPTNSAEIRAHSTATHGVPVNVALMVATTHPTAVHMKPCKPNPAIRSTPYQGSLAISSAVKTKVHQGSQMMSLTHRDGFARFTAP
jgi:hypothetical protein